MRLRMHVELTSSSLIRSLRWRPYTGYLALVILLMVAGLGVLLGSGSDKRHSSVRSDESFFPVWASDSHYNQPLWVRDTDSALGRMNLQPKQLSLRDLARVHGHLCDGLVVSWVEIKLLLERMFPQGVVDRTDLRVVAKNGPCWVDAAGWMTGARVNHGTLVLDNAVGNGFVIQRISTAEAMRARLKAGIFPAELAKLEQSMRTRRASGGEVTSGEIDRFEAMATEFCQRLLNTSPETMVLVERLEHFEFPTRNQSLIVPRSDSINRYVARTESVSQKEP